MTAVSTDKHVFLFSPDKEEIEALTIYPETLVQNIVLRVSWKKGDLKRHFSLLARYFDARNREVKIKYTQFNFPDPVIELFPGNQSGDKYQGFTCSYIRFEYQTNESLAMNIAAFAFANEEERKAWLNKSTDFYIDVL